MSNDTTIYFARFIKLLWYAPVRSVWMPLWPQCFKSRMWTKHDYSYGTVDDQDALESNETNRNTRCSARLASRIALVLIVALLTLAAALSFIENYSDSNIISTNDDFISDSKSPTMKPTRSPTLSPTSAPSQSGKSGSHVPTLSSRTSFPSVS